MFKLNDNYLKERRLMPTVRHILIKKSSVLV